MRSRLITGLESDPARPDMVRVMVNGRPYATVPALRAVAAGLGPGVTLDEERSRSVNQAADEEAAYRTLLRALERRPFAVVEIRRWLLRKGHPPEAIDPALARAGDAGLLDDTAFAAGYVRSRTERGRGPARIQRDLSALGVSREIIENALRTALPEDHDTELAAESLARRRLTQLRSVPLQVRIRRALAYLARRGFSGYQVSEMVRRVAAERSGTASEA
jgi:regulatory protein